MRIDGYTEIEEKAINTPYIPNIDPCFIVVNSIVDVKVGSYIFFDRYWKLQIIKIENGGLVYKTDHHWRLSNIQIQQLINEGRVRNIQIQQLINEGRVRNVN